VRGVVASSGSLVGSTAYAWGNPETLGGLSSFTPFGFAGAYGDSTGLMYLIGRYYDPQTGQFLSVDPLVNKTGQPYAYTGDDPVNDTDPSGLACDWTSVFSPWRSSSCFKQGWEMMSGAEQLANATLPITLPLTALAGVSGLADLAGVSVLGLGETGTTIVALGSGAAATSIDAASVSISISRPRALAQGSLHSVSAAQVWGRLWVRNRL
jgi:RHS repeat-associated protein